MKKTFLFFLCMIISFCLLSADEIWKEDFNDEALANKGHIGPSTTDVTDCRWTIDITNGSFTASTDWFCVKGGVFEGRDVDGTQQTNGTGEGPVWISEAIDISSYSDISISLDVSENGTMEALDFIKASYKVDAGAITQFGHEYDDFTSTTFSVNSLNGNSLIIYVEMDNNSGTEYTRFDNVLVSGTPGGAAPYSTIAPSGEQNLLTSVNGTQLTVTENLNGDTVASRDWGYRTVSEGAVSSLSTGTTIYTPNFSSADSYYVVCTTTYTTAGAKISNEVVVNVVAPQTLPYTEPFDDSAWSAYDGWTYDDFVISNSNDAAGTAYEAELTYSVDVPGSSHITSPAISTTGETALTLTWDQNTNFFETGAGNDYQIAVYTSTDGSTFTNQVWSQTVTVDETEMKTVSLDAGDGVGNSTLYLRWLYVANNTNRFSNWNIDNISLAVPSGNDDDSEVYAGTQPTAGGIASTATASGNAVNVLQAVIEDMGGDSKATKVTRIRIKPHITNTADWSTHIEGITVNTTSRTLVPITYDIYSSYINIDIVAGNLDIADDTSETINVAVYLQTGGLSDNAIISFLIDADAHSWMADASGSTFASTFTLGDFNSNNKTVKVDLSKLAFTAQPSDVGEDSAMAPAITVAWMDVHDNVDVDANGSDFSLALTTTGTFAGTATTTVDAVGGIATFSNLVFSAAGNSFTLSTVDLDGWGVDSVTSNAFNVTEAAAASPLLISEVADPSDNYNARYIELYNSSDSAINFDSSPNTNWDVKIYANGNTTAGATISLSGTIGAYDTYLIGGSVVVSAYGVSVDKSFTITINGDDTVVLTNDDVAVDIYGEIGTDGTGEAWEYLDGRGERKFSVTAARNSWLASEWNVMSSQSVSDMTPKSHGGGATATVQHDTASVPNNDTPVIFNASDAGAKVEMKQSGGAAVTIAVTAYSGDTAPATDSPDNVIKQWWNIEASAAVTADLKFYYDEANLNGIGEAALELLHYTGGEWVLISGTSVNTTDNYLQVDNYGGGFSPMTLGLDPLPAELSSFSAACINQHDASICWTTQSENNVLGFHVYKNTAVNLSSAVAINTAYIRPHNSSSVNNYSVTDEDVDYDTTYYYWLRIADYDGTVEFCGPIQFTISDPGHVTPHTEIPQVTHVVGNYPNPFNPSTNIRFYVKEAGNVKVEIFNTLGQKICTKSKYVKAGIYESIVWEGRDKNGRETASGVYFYRVTIGAYTQMNKMVLIK